MIEFSLLLLVGLIAGIFAGLLGIGGGIVFTPVIFFMFESYGVENPVVWTIGTSLFCTFLAASSSSVQQLRQHNIFLREGIKLGLVGVIGVTFGKLVVTSTFYSVTEFSIVFSLMLGYVAFMMFKKGNEAITVSTSPTPEMKMKEFTVTGGIGGLISVLAGVGGGGIMVPIMNGVFGQPFKKAVSVSSLAMVILVFSGWVQMALANAEGTAITEYTIGYIDFGLALPVGIGALLGGLIGAYLNQIVQRKYLQWIFAVLALVMSFRLIWSAFLS